MRQWLSANEGFLLSLLEYLDTPISLAVWLRVKYRCWDSLALCWVDPRNYPEGLFSSLRFRKDVQAVDLLRKAPLPTTFARRDVALKTWGECEKQCYLTNEFVARICGPYVKDARDQAFADFLGECQKRMKRWLGPLPDRLEGGFGPGTCFEYEGRDPTVVDKIWLRPMTTSSCAALFEWHYSQTLWGNERWRDQLGSPGLVRGNRFTTVPKDGKTDRAISIEPLGNLWLQLGIGRYLKTRLHMIGFPAYKPDSREIVPGYRVSGTDAQQQHRALLWRCNESFSTIDLSNASDTIAFELIKAVFPPDWFDLLNDCRSKLTFVPSKDGGVWHYLEKFSSMGNGFTFEMESLTFAVLLSVAFGLKPGHDLWVFGDDIILPKIHFDSACNLLKACGFTPNIRKSYKDGPFYESCGGNLHGMVETTPVRFTKPVEDPSSVYSHHNALYKWGFPLWLLKPLRMLVPRRLQFPGPNRLGDVVLHGLPFSYREIDGIRWVKILSMKPEVSIPLERWSPELAMVSLLLGSTTHVTRRNSSVIPTMELASIS